MTTLIGRPDSALVVIDCQNQVLEGTWDRDRVVANVATLVDKARAARLAVVWVQDHGDGCPRGSEGWQIVPELKPDETESLVDKTYPDSFEETCLEDVLAARGISKLFVAGAQTDECIRSTLHGAIVRGYDVSLVADAHTTEDLSEYGAPTPDLVVGHTNLYWKHHRAPGRTAGTVETDEVDFSG